MAPELNASVTNGISSACVDGADGVGQQHRRRGVGPHLRDAHQRAVVAAHPHQKVGEGQVGQQLPLADHRVQVVDGVAGQDGVLGEQVTEGGHRASLRWRVGRGVS